MIGDLALSGAGFRIRPVETAARCSTIAALNGKPLCIPPIGSPGLALGCGQAGTNDPAGPLPSSSSSSPSSPSAQIWPPTSAAIAVASSSFVCM